MGRRSKGHGLTIEGPSRLVDSPLDKDRKRRLARLMGDPLEAPEKFIPRFLSRAFRGPVDDATVAIYINIYQQHIADGQIRTRRCTWSFAMC